jgi:hypothetical protein
MTATSSDLPRRGVRTLDERDTAPVDRTLTTLPQPDDPQPPDSAATWLGRRIAVADDHAPAAQHIGWLAEKLAAVGDKADKVMQYLAVADQYRQIAAVCADRAGITAPKGPDDKEHA